MPCYPFLTRDRSDNCRLTDLTHSDIEKGEHDVRRKEAVHLHGSQGDPPHGEDPSVRAAAERQDRPLQGGLEYLISGAELEKFLKGCED